MRNKIYKNMIICVCAAMFLMACGKKETETVAETPEVVEESAEETVEEPVETEPEVVEVSQRPAGNNEILVEGFDDNCTEKERIDMINEYYRPFAIDFLSSGLVVASISTVNSPEAVNDGLYDFINMLQSYDDNIKCVKYICGDDPEFALVKSLADKYLSIDCSQMSSMTDAEASRVMQAVKTRSELVTAMTDEICRILEPYTGN